MSVTLLEKIQEELANPDVSLETVLLKCQILASRVGSAELTKWVQQELRGYSGKDNLPEYRIVPAGSYGHLSGPCGSGAKNAPIPSSCLPEVLREEMQQARFFDGVAKLESLVRRSKGAVRLPWDPDLTASVSAKHYHDQGWSLLAADRIVHVSSLEGILGAIRTRLLAFILEVEAISPDVGERGESSSSVPAERITQVFHNHIFGSNVAIGSQHVSQTTVYAIKAGDLESLRRFLAAKGVSERDLRQLEDALRKEPRPSADGAFGRRVAKWIGRMTRKAAAGTWKIGAAVAAELIASAIKQYYGMQ